MTDDLKKRMDACAEQAIQYMVDISNDFKDSRMHHVKSTAIWLQEEVKNMIQIIKETESSG
ncbi:MAG: hypothetical protein LBH89_02920 [Lactococcus lactis]|jgi:hypothetical protein|nr:hypothetical protein [Lactococcus lactis]